MLDARRSNTNFLPPPGVRLLSSEEFGRIEKVHLHPNTDGNKYRRKVDDPAKNFEPQNEDARIDNQVLNSFCARFCQMS